MSFLLISIAPLVLVATLYLERKDGHRAEQERQWVSAMYGGIHMLFINPVVTLLGIFSLYSQMRKTLAQPSVGVLSIYGLAVQAVVFAFVAISWPFRLNLGPEFPGIPLSALGSWYQLVGWATVDNAIFATVQAVLFWIAVRRSGDGEVVISSDDTTPLLGSGIVE